MAGAYPSFCSMKQLGMRAATPPWMGAGLPPAVCRRYPFYTPRWRETMWGKVACLREQHDGRDWGSNHRRPICANHYTDWTPP